MNILKTAYYTLGCLVFLIIILLAWWTYAHGVPMFERRLSTLEAWIAAQMSGGSPH